MGKDLIGRYVWIIDTLTRYGKLSRAELNRLWMRSPRSNGEEMPARTFFHYRRAIEENFNIEIVCDNNGEYYIDNGDTRQSRALTNWMLDQHAMSSAMKLSPEAIERVDIEDVPSAREYFPMAFDAVSHCQKILFSYAGFNRARIETDILFSPYMLKRYKQRWYMVGAKEKGGDLRTYALDRVRDMKLTNETFTIPEGYNPDDIFGNIIGVTTSQAPVKTVRIMTSAKQAKYFRALPLHPSQQEIISDNYSVFTFKLKLNYELVHELLSFGSNVKVLEPRELITMVTNELTSALELYDDPGAIPSEEVVGKRKRSVQKPAKSHEHPDIIMTGHPDIIREEKQK